MGLYVNGVVVRCIRLRRGDEFERIGVVRGVEVARTGWSGLPARIILLADIHVHRASKLELVEDVVARVSGGGDLVVLAGDIWDEDTPSVELVEELASRLKKYGRFRVAVTGNHEEWSTSVGFKEGVKSLEDNGFYVLLDDQVQLGGLVVAGYKWREDPRKYPAGLAREADIVVSHSPDVFPFIPRGGSDKLVLAGHTHGGQYCLPGSRPLITNSVYGYTWGAYRSAGKTLVLSRGLGEKREVRVFCPRQVVVIEPEEER